ncbi:MAG: cytidine deaminase [Flavobacteriales bacterium]|nr:cytidine deaminase [Flavobacteriales bacterium]
MKQQKLITSISIFDSANELENSVNILLRAAHAQLVNSYSPYSRYRVAASVLMENGEIVTGTNQENMAYPSGLCAERVAVFAAGSRFPRMKMKALAIVATHADHDSNTPSASCGACRQSMLEYEMNQGENIQIIMQGKTGPVWIAESVGSLLPLFFNESGLKKE